MARKPFNWVCLSCKEKRVTNNLIRYHSKHHDDVKRREKERYHADIEKFRARALLHLNKLSPEEREIKRMYNREYHRINRKERQLYSNEYYKQPCAKIGRTCRARQAELVKRGLMNKGAHTEELNGCSWKQLKEHLEQQFRSEMTWNNYGTVWHIDHIKPVCSFDLTKQEEQLKCFHYTNLQPLLAKENLVKGSKIV